MKKKVLHILALLTALALVVGLGFFANALMGNPISKRLATGTAKAHLEETYGDTDFYIEKLNYNFKNGNYIAYIESPTSIDSYFYLALGMDGKLLYDEYETLVLNGWNTSLRLNDQYHDLVNPILESPDLPFGLDFGYGELECMPREYIGGEGVSPYALVQEELELDHSYDIRQLGAEAGHLVIYAKEETVSIQRAAKILLEVRALMDEKNIPFRTVKFVLRSPQSENSSQSEKRIETLAFLYEDIHENGMTERVKAANDAAIAYYAKQDALYKED